MGKGFLMCDEIHEWIDKNIPKGSVILELGSGKGTQRLADNGYIMYSIEHSKKWMNKYDSHYIYAPIRKGWYHVNSIQKNIPKHYDLFIIDGPPRKVDEIKVGRWGLIDHLDIFNTNVYMIFDDTDRRREHRLVLAIAETIGRSAIKYKGYDHRGKGTKFSVFEKVENGI